MAEPSTNTEMVRVPILGENGRISDDYIPESIPQAVTAVGQAAEAAASSANEALQKAAAAEKAASSASSSAEQAKTYANNASTYMSTAGSHAESAAIDAQAASVSASAAAASAAAAEGSNKSAAQSSADAMGFRNNAVQYRDQAREAAQEAQGYVTTVQQLEQNATNSATAAQNSATSASASAETATTAASQASTSATNAAASAQTASQKADAVLNHYIESAQATTLEPGSQATATVADKVLQLGIPKGEKGDTGLGIPEGGSAGQVVKKTADGTEWAYDTGAVYNSEEGLQEMAEDGTHDPIYNFGITQGGMSASMSVMGDSPEVAADYSAASVSYRNAIGADADGPYVDLNLSGAAEGATKYRYIDDPSKFATSDGIPTTKAVSSAIGGGNVLKGTLGPAPLLSADDAYATKPRRLTVYGETRQNLWVNPSGTINGVTVTANADGSITVSGTATGSGAPRIKSYVLKPGSTYTVSINAAMNNGACVSVQERNSDDSLIAYHDCGLSSSNLSTTFTVDGSCTSVNFIVYVPRGVTASGTYRVMLNEGSEPEPWCPPGLNSVDELAIVVSTTDSADDGTTTPIDLDGNTLCSLPDGTHDELTIGATGAVTLVQRVGVATAPTDAGSWSFDSSVERATFSLTDRAVAPQDDESGLLLCDKLPPRKEYDLPSYALVGGVSAYAKNPAITSTATAATVAGGAKYIYELAEPQTIPLPAVTLPTLPAPTVNVRADAEASGAGYAMGPDVELEYERDVTIAFNKLQAQVSELTVNQATS